MTKDDTLDFDLDVFFEAAKDPLPTPSAALMTNILADAGEVTAARYKPPVYVPVKTPWYNRLLEPLGGLQGAFAVAFVAVLGVTVGYTGTDSLQSVPGVGTLVASISGDPIDDFSYGAITGFDDFLSEG